MRQKFDLPVLNRQKGVAQFARGKLCHAAVSSPVFAQEKGLKGHNKTYFQSLFYHLSLLHTSQAISTQPQIEFWAWGPCLVVDQGLTKLLIKQHWTLLTAVPLLYFAVATAYTLGVAAVLVLPPYKAARLCLLLMVTTTYYLQRSARPTLCTVQYTAVAGTSLPQSPTSLNTLACLQCYQFWYECLVTYVVEATFPI